MYLFYFVSSTFAQLYGSEQKALEVKAEFLHAWNGYKKFAYGKDELKPISGGIVNDRFQGWGVTLIDSLSTLWLMDLRQEFVEAVAYVSQVDFKKTKGPVLFFETVIRYLGGLLSAYDLSNLEVLKEKAIELGELLYLAFSSPSGFPWYRFDFQTLQGDNNGGKVILAEVGTITLEFTRLSSISKDPKYRMISLKVMNKLKQLTDLYNQSGLLPVYLDVNTGVPVTQKISFGSLGDSYYEYLLKFYIMRGDHMHKKMFMDSMEGLKGLVRKGYNNHLYFGEIDEKGEFVQNMDHLSFFVPGLLALGETAIGNTDYLHLAVQLCDSIWEIYQQTATKLGPEAVIFNKSKKPHLAAPVNYLRPEYVESLFYLYKLTGDSVYPDRVYEIFKAMKKYSKTDIAYAGYKDVNNVNMKESQIDTMESFFLAETLKYMYLSFKNRDFINLQEWVFNTEAHPLKIMTRKNKDEEAPFDDSPSGTTNMSALGFTPTNIGSGLTSNMAQSSAGFNRFEY